MRTGMLFWPLVALCLIAIAVFLDTAAPEGIPGVADRGRGFVWVVVLAAGLGLAGAGRGLARGGWRTARHSVTWLAVFAVAATLHAHRADLGRLHDLLRGTLYPAVALTTAPGEAELRRAWDGHYRARTEVNGVPMHLMIDTGASMVLLPYEDAAALGFDPAELDFSQPVTTANGMSSVAPIRIASIRIGPITVSDVEAAVAHPGRLKTGLLGLSFIDRLSEVSFHGGTLTLRK